MTETHKDHHGTEIPEEADPGITASAIKTIISQRFYDFQMSENKKRDSAESQPFVNLKSNTMKNTLQR
jgi:hypothetical protein